MLGIARGFLDPGHTRVSPERQSDYFSRGRKSGQLRTGWGGYFRSSGIRGQRMKRLDFVRT